jgi:hypothetical protein
MSTLRHRDAGDRANLPLGFLIRWSKLLGFRQEMGLAEYHLSGIVGILRQLDRLLFHVYLRLLVQNCGQQRIVDLVIDQPELAKLVQ